MEIGGGGNDCDAEIITGKDSESDADRNNRDRNNRSKTAVTDTDHSAVLKTPVVTSSVGLNGEQVLGGISSGISSPTVLNPPSPLQPGQHFRDLSPLERYRALACDRVSPTGADHLQSVSHDVNDSHTSVNAENRMTSLATSTAVPSTQNDVDVNVSVGVFTSSTSVVIETRPGHTQTSPLTPHTNDSHNAPQRRLPSSRQPSPHSVPESAHAHDANSRASSQQTPHFRDLSPMERYRVLSCDNSISNEENRVSDSNGEGDGGNTNSDGGNTNSNANSYNVGNRSQSNQSHISGPNVNDNGVRGTQHFRDLSPQERFRILSCDRNNDGESREEIISQHYNSNSHPSGDGRRTGSFSAADDYSFAQSRRPRSRTDHHAERNNNSSHGGSSDHVRPTISVGLGEFSSTNSVGLRSRTSGASTASQRLSRRSSSLQPESLSSAPSADNLPEKMHSAASLYQTRSAPTARETAKPRAESLGGWDASSGIGSSSGSSSKRNGNSHDSQNHNASAKFGGQKSKSSCSGVGEEAADVQNEKAGATTSAADQKVKFFEEDARPGVSEEAGPRAQPGGTESFAAGSFGDANRTRSIDNTEGHEDASTGKSVPGKRPTRNASEKRSSSEKRNFKHILNPSSTSSPSSPAPVNVFPSSRSSSHSTTVIPPKKFHEVFPRSRALPKTIVRNIIPGGGGNKNFPNQLENLALLGNSQYDKSMKRTRSNGNSAATVTTTSKSRRPQGWKFGLQNSSIGFPRASFADDIFFTVLEFLVSPDSITSLSLVCKRWKTYCDLIKHDKYPVRRAVLDRDSKLFLSASGERKLKAVFQERRPEFFQILELVEKREYVRGREISEANSKNESNSNARMRTSNRGGGVSLSNSKSNTQLQYPPENCDARNQSWTIVKVPSDNSESVEECGSSVIDSSLSESAGSENADVKGCVTEEGVDGTRKTSNFKAAGKAARAHRKKDASGGKGLLRKSRNPRPSSKMSSRLVAESMRLQNDISVSGFSNRHKQAENSRDNNIQEIQEASEKSIREAASGKSSDVENRNNVMMNGKVSGKPSKSLESQSSQFERPSESGTLSFSLSGQREESALQQGVATTAISPFRIFITFIGIGMDIVIQLNTLCISFRFVFNISLNLIIPNSRIPFYFLHFFVPCSSGCKI